jgi:phage repressor protein C with HTH and peptisase S24 domain
MKTFVFNITLFNTLHMDDDLLVRLNNAYNLLLDNGILHKRQDLADAVGTTKSVISQAFNGVSRYLTLGLMRRIADAFPDVISREYMEHGIGEVAKKQGVPHIPYEVSAGGVGISLGAVSLNDCEMFAPITNLGRYDFTIDVHGDSMEPELRSGDILACRWADVNNIDSTKFYVLDTDGGAVVKSLEDKGATIVCTSLNKKYEQFSVTKHDALRIALVVGVMRKY